MKCIRRGRELSVAYSGFTFSPYAADASHQKEERMHIVSVGSMPNVAPMTRSSEAAEGPGPDHDGDSDDKGGAVKSAMAPGVGSVVDATA
jgi:hypothetical protein